MVSLYVDGVIAVLCPVISDIAAGIAMITAPRRDTDIMAADRCVQAGMVTCQVLHCAGFPGDALRG